MNRTDPLYPEFKKEFWKWFDALPKSKRRQFMYFKEDIAETNFYFTVWSKKKNDTNSTSNSQ